MLSWSCVAKHVWMFWQLERRSIEWKAGIFLSIQPPRVNLPLQSQTQNSALSSNLVSSLLSSRYIFESFRQVRWRSSRSWSWSLGSGLERELFGEGQGGSPSSPLHFPPPGIRFMLLRDRYIRFRFAGFTPLTIRFAPPWVKNSGGIILQHLCCLAEVFTDLVGTQI